MGLERWAEARAAFGDFARQRRRAARRRRQGAARLRHGHLRPPPRQVGRGRRRLRRGRRRAAAPRRLRPLRGGRRLLPHQAARRGAGARRRRRPRRDPLPGVAPPPRRHPPRAVEVGRGRRPLSRLPRPLAERHPRRRGAPSGRPTPRRSSATRRRPSSATAGILVRAIRWRRCAERAKPRLDALVGGLPADQRAKVTTLTPAELEERGRVYFDAMRNELAEADFKAVLKAKTLDKALRCEASLPPRADGLQGAPARRAPRRSSTPPSPPAPRSPRRDYYVRVAVPGRALVGLGGAAQEGDRALRGGREGTGTTRSPTTPRCARPSSGSILEEQGDKTAGAQAEAILAAIPERFPDGDMKAEALWRLAWRAWRKADYEGVIRWLDREIAVVPHEENYWAEGQTHYWKARAFDKLGKNGRRPRRLRAHACASIRSPTTRSSRSTALRGVVPDDFEKLVGELKGAPGEPEALALRAARRLRRARLPARRRAPAPRPGRGRRARALARRPARARGPQEGHRSRPGREAVGDGAPLRPRAPLRQVALDRPLVRPRLQGVVAEARRTAPSGRSPIRAATGTSSSRRRRRRATRPICSSPSSARRARSIRSWSRSPMPSD